MKKTTLILAILLLSFVSKAQEQTASTSPWSFGVLAGPSLSYFHRSPKWETSEDKELLPPVTHKLSFYAGGYAALQMNEHWKLTARLFYTSRRTQYNPGPIDNPTGLPLYDSFLEYTLAFNRHYINTSVLADYRIGQSRFHLQLGPSVGKNIYSKRHRVDTDQKTKDEGNWHNIEIAIHANIAYDITSKLQLQLQYLHSVNSIYNQENYGKHGKHFFYRTGLIGLSYQLF